MPEIVKFDRLMSCPECGQMHSYELLRDAFVGEGCGVLIPAELFGWWGPTHVVGDLLVKGFALAQA